MSEGMKFVVNGGEYAVDDFEGRELVDAERSFGISLFSELERNSITGVYAILYLIKKRENASFTVEQALDLNLGDVSKMFEDDTQEDEQAPPPKAAAKGRAKSA